MKIDMSKYQDRESKVFSGRNNGVVLRKQLKLDELDNKDEQVEISIPIDTFSFNISFFLGLFGDSVRALGKSRFKEKYDFKCTEVIQQNIDDGIERALKNPTLIF